MKQYRKRPVVIEAVQYTKETCAAIHEWLGYEHRADEAVCGIGPITIGSWEGEMEAKPGDWIIKGIKGEFYPCKPDIFEATYQDAAQATEDVDGDIALNLTKAMLWASAAGASFVEQFAMKGKELGSRGDALDFVDGIIEEAEAVADTFVEAATKRMRT